MIPSDRTSQARSLPSPSSLTPVGEARRSTQTRRRRRRKYRRRIPAVVWALLAIAALAGGAAIVALPLVVPAARDARNGQNAIERAVAALQASSFDAAEAEFGQAAAGFDGARRKLASKVMIPARLVPGISRQIRSARGLSEAGWLAAQAGQATARTFAASPPQSWRRPDGSFDLRAMGRVEQALRPAAATAAQAVGAVRASPASLIVPQLHAARVKAERALAATASRVRGAVTGLSLGTRLLGGAGKRRHAVLFANLAELRGTGGFYGFFAIVESDRGRISIAAQGRPRLEFPPLNAPGVQSPAWFAEAWGPLGALSLWTNLNLSPDFPTVAEVAVSALRAAPGPVDGVIQIDADGIASILRVAGPIRIGAWPEQITADNVARIAQHEVYLRKTTEPERDDFGQQLLEAAINAFRTRPFVINDANLKAFDAAARGGHLQLYERRSNEQELLTRLGLTGGLDRADEGSDLLGVYTINAAANKLDWFLRRRIAMAVRLDPATGTVTSRTTVALENTAPAGLPQFIAGPNVESLRSGENRLIVAFVRPSSARLLSSTVDGRPVALETYGEGNRRGYRTVVRVPAGETVTVALETVADAGLAGGSRGKTYDLRLLRQPTASPDGFQVRMTAASGWRTGDADRTTRLDRDVQITAEVKRSWLRVAFDAILSPIRAIERVVD